MDFDEIPVGTRVSFLKPPPSHGRLKVFILGVMYSGNSRYLVNRSCSNKHITKEQWKDYEGYVYKEKEPSNAEKIKALEAKVDSLENDVIELASQFRDFLIKYVSQNRG